MTADASPDGGPHGVADGGADQPAAASAEPRQSVVRQPGTSRRAKLTPAPGTDPDPHPPVLREEGGVVPVDPAGPGTRGVNDDRLRQDRPPHW
ncbi:hypothetical protein E3T26_02300 [Cryobacterium sp. TMT1-21]|uniref:Uncharacterized protein n=1 Tax=Cryobacterium shii TaxID=1259235 RepID=A0AAQ2HFA9_9MICO|nr:MULTISPECIES: hypothetical protein [Cryobacterium]TFC46412.1 hypothetical protein E3O49_09885 [Cryobacterium shii]TFD17334.1 hypothetical protein E3T26_02300 [Cryobacterium sp. TMT1-21]TFD17725.1 hypothetical protein E3T32_13565 [Cryobacterium sp. TMT2-23]TFD38479.1 hypothetical protein E3T37_09750 [Cryobacterium sp. TMT2-10]